ncbi:hypothetical protein [Rhodococcus opacus]|uniref:Uncharacterized protein n=1 Tax=Rhodococcus opacus TaxID=37919 RepID=A0AAX3YQR9_RHOOP|nr:hypothetical protein [Rhodococcus opacus]WLF51538.1 hypothetical protein Q5707_38945 [Rhodococcus opacus]
MTATNVVRKDQIESARFVIGEGEADRGEVRNSWDAHSDALASLEHAHLA